MRIKKKTIAISLYFKHDLFTAAYMASITVITLQVMLFSDSLIKAILSSKNMTLLLFFAVNYLDCNYLGFNL